MWSSAVGRIVILILGLLVAQLTAHAGPAGAFKQKGTVSLWKSAFGTPSTYFLICRTGFLVISQYSKN